MLDYLKIAREVLEIEATTLLEAKSRIDKSFERFIDILYKTEGKVIITGVGKSGLVGNKIAATLASTGTSSFFIHPTEAMHGDLGMIQKSDTIVAISYSGESEELKEILPHLKRLGVEVVTMTKSDRSSIARLGSSNISIEVSKEACPLNIAPTSSTTLTMALGDAIAVALMKRRDFKSSDFAMFHPGGSLGKRLFIKVEDIMRKDNIPISKESIPLSEAIVAMSEGKLGSLFLVDDKGALSGVLSDGDLRRALLKSDFSLKNSALKYATKNPFVIQDSTMLASKLLEIVEEKKIQIVAICDNFMRIVGVVHLHMLVETGIKSS